MEADWSVEIGADLPLIVVPWEGFVDLRRDASLVSGIEEAASPALAQALIRLNEASSPVFTSKCDLWPLTAGEIDPLEFDARHEEAQQGIGCYIDIVARRASLFTCFAAHEAWVRSAVDELRRAKLRQARSDLVVRAGQVAGRDGFAVTLYVAASGATQDVAESALSAALESAATITIKLTAAGE